MTKLLYRFDESTESSGYLDEYGDWRSSGTPRTTAVLREFEVLRSTPCGEWIVDSWTGLDRFVLRDARKRFACATVEEAKRSFRARKARQMRILTARIRAATAALHDLDAWTEDGKRLDALPNPLRLS